MAGRRTREAQAGAGAERPSPGPAAGGTGVVGGFPGVAEELIALELLHEDPANPNEHDEEDIAGMMAKLAAFGQVEPLVVQKSTGMIIGGNGRKRAMLRLGWSHARVWRLDVDDVRARALSIALNTRKSKLNELTLAQHLRALRSEDFDLFATGFSAAEVDALCEKLGDDALEEAGGLDDDGGGDPEPPPTPPQPDTVNYAVSIQCRDEPHQKEVLDRLIAEGLVCFAYRF